LNGVMIERINFDINILSCRLLMGTAGSAGTLSADLQYKRGVGAWTSIFSTPPSIAYTEGDFAISTNQVLSVTQLLIGDLLRLNISSGQTAGTEFHMLLEFERT
jgi:hypothetical protein